MEATPVDMLMMAARLQDMGALGCRLAACFTSGRKAW